MSQNTSLNNTVVVTPKKCQTCSGNSSQSYSKSEYFVISAKFTERVSMILRKIVIGWTAVKNVVGGWMEDVETSTMKTLTKGKDSLCIGKISFLL